MLNSQATRLHNHPGAGVYVQTVDLPPSIVTLRYMSEDREAASSGRDLGVGMGIGIAIGVAIGSATDNLGLWIAVGVAIGAAIGAGLSNRE